MPSNFLTILVTLEAVQRYSVLPLFTSDKKYELVGVQWNSQMRRAKMSIGWSIRTLPDFSRKAQNGK